MTAGVSFVCTVYNKEAHLPGVIAALARQVPDRPRQFIFVDDGSQDGSVAVVRQLTAGWPDTVIVERPNGGPSAATNTGFAFATQPFIKLLGSDDILAPYATALLLAVAEAHEVGAVYTRMGFYRRPEELVFDEDEGRATPVTVPADPVQEALRRGLAGTSSTLYRADAVRAAQGCDPAIFVEDHSLALRVARVARVARLEHVLARGPAGDETRISVERENQVHHDNVLAMTRLLEAHPALIAPHGAMALRVAAGRALRFLRRTSGPAALKAEMRWLGLRARALPPRDITGALRRTLVAYVGRGLPPILQARPHPAG